MAGNVKGITIEFRGDVTPLQKAMKTLNKEANAVNKDLKAVNDALKFNPTSTELLTQKQTLLKTKIGDTEKKVKELKAAQAELDAKGVDKTSAEYMRLEREIVTTESKLESLRKEFKKVENVSLAKVGAQLQDVGGKMKNVGTAMTKYVTGPIVAFATAAIAATNETRELRADLNKLDVAFESTGFSTDDAASSMQDFYRLTGEDDTSIEAANHLAELCDNQKDLATWGDIAAGVYAKFGDSLPLEGLTEAANETAKVGSVTGPLADALNWVGISEDAFNEKLAKCNSEQERSRLITDTLSDAYSNIGQEYLTQSGNITKMRDAELKLKQATADVADALEPLVSTLYEMGADALSFLEPKIKAVSEWFSNLSPGAQKAVVAIAGIVAAVGPLLVVFGSLVTMIGGIMAAGTVAVAVAGGIVAGILAVIAIIVIWLKYGDKIKKFFKDVTKDIVNGVKNWVKAFKEIPAKVKKVFDDVKKAITDKFNAAVDFVKTKIAQIKGFFSNLKLKIPKIGTEALTALITFVKTKIAQIKAFFTGLKLKLPNIGSAALTKVVSAVKTGVAKIKAFFTGLKLKLPSIGSGGLTKVVSAAKSGVGKIKGFFTGLSLKLPSVSIPDFVAKVKEKISSIKTAIKNAKLKLGIKIPKVKVSGGKAPFGIGGKGKLPSFSVDWHKQGGIFKNPTLLMSGNGAMHGVGEAGAEAILPLSELWAHMDGMSNSIVNGVSVLLAAQNANAGEATITIPIYLYPSGPKMGEETVKMYDKYKKILKG